MLYPTRMNIHAFIKIIVYIACLIGVNFLPVKWFWLSCIIVLVLAFILEGPLFFKRCYRLRWLFLSIFFIYALTTPGEYIALFELFDNLTKEGVSLGLVQISKILMAIACLSIVFYRTGVSALISGLYRLLLPLAWLGLPINRFVVRLLLTLQYVDGFTRESDQTLNFLNVYDMIKTNDEQVELTVVDVDHDPLSAVDILIATLLIGGVLVLGIVNT